jgi:hypothetical protein
MAGSHTIAAGFTTTNGYTMIRYRIYIRTGQPAIAAIVVRSISATS